MAKMSIMEERLRRIGQRWAGNTSKADGSPSQSRTADLIVDMNSDGTENISRLSSISSLADVAKGAVLGAFPTPPARAVRTPRSGLDSPERNALSVEQANAADQAGDRRPSASSTLNIVSDSETCALEKKDGTDTQCRVAKPLDPALGLQLSPSEATTCLGSPRSSNDSSPDQRHLSTDLQIGRNDTSGASSVVDEQARSSGKGSSPDCLARHPTTRYQEQPSQMPTCQGDLAATSSTHRAKQKPREWLVPPTEDIADWGDLEIIGRSR